jgi:hypothetical protein
MAAAVTAMIEAVAAFNGKVGSSDKDSGGSISEEMLVCK